MSGGKLIFSFNDGLNLAVKEEKLAGGAVIKFGSGFEHLMVSYDNSALSLVGQEEVQDKAPTIEFTVKPKTEQTVEASGQNIPEVGEPASLPTTFHAGIVEEKRNRLTKTQRRNRNRRYRKKQDQLEREAEVQELAVATTVADYTPTDVIPVVEEYVPQYVHRVPPRQIISEDELERFQEVKVQNFEHFQRVKGEMVNVLEGLELHTGIFSEKEQRKILRAVYDFRDKGRAGFLLPRTYSEPKKWMKGKGRITI